MSTASIEKFISPCELSQAVDVSESTLKRWIDRGLIRAYRTAGGHRRLQLSDVIHFIRTSGVPVVHPESLGLGSVDLTERSTAISPGHVEKFVTALVEGRRPCVRACLLRPFMAGVTISRLADELIGPALHAVGLRWACGEVTVYAEHHAMQLAALALSELRNYLPATGTEAPLALGAAPENDPYFLPSMLAECALTELGWRTMNLGPFTPIASLAEAVAHQRPRLVWISLTSVPVQGNAAEYRQVVDAAERAGGQVIVGGQALGAGVPPPPNHRVGRRLDDLVRLADELWRRPTPPPRRVAASGRDAVLTD